MTKHVVFVTWKMGNALTFEAAKRLGHRVTLIRSAKMEKSQNVDFSKTRFVEFVDNVHLLDDATQIDVLRECIHRINQSDPIDGFVATVDALVVPVARIAEELGIAFTSSHGAETAKLKHKCRQKLAACGVESTRHEIVTTLEQARRFALDVGFPIVLKPACGSASEGAYILVDDASLSDCFAKLDKHENVYRLGVLVEEYLKGKFVSAEIGICRGRILPLAISERKTWNQHEALELGTTIPAAISTQDYDAAMNFAARVIQAVELGLGIFHVEIMMTGNGPRLIELNPRIMGSCLPNLFYLAGGGDIFELLVRVYLNEDVEMAPVKFDRYATVRWFGAANTQARPAMPDLSWATAHEPSLHSLSINFPNVEQLAPCRGNLGNFGEVQVVHANYETSIDIAESIVSRIESDIGFELTR